MLTVLLASALAASPYADANADVVTSATVPAPREAVHAALEDLDTFKAILPCASDWAFGSVRKGQGASVELTYDVASMHRRLTAVVSKTEAPRLVDFDHAGNKGFVTRWKLTEQADGTLVELTTYLNAPPWPFRKVYFKRVQPAWEACYDEALAALPDHVDVRPPVEKAEAVPETPTVEKALMEESEAPVVEK
ncbi:MAG: SRPBCC family protein [Proteobacteria bacterium]|nr:SRPBCC family protein [Pseudomonadota bacterium]